MSTTAATVGVRTLLPGDVEDVVALDAAITGRRRDKYLLPKLSEALEQGGIRVSLAAEQEGRLVGFLLAKVWHGEFGALEPVAVLDTLGVHPRLRRQGVGAALLDQLRANLDALGIGCLRTEVAWDDPDLLGFFHREGFVPAARLVLQTDPRSDASRERRDRRVAERDPAS